MQFCKGKRNFVKCYLVMEELIQPMQFSGVFESQQVSGIL